MIEWTLYGEANAEFGAAKDGQGPLKRQKTMPRRVSIKVASPTSERLIGRCLSFAKPGETFGAPSRLKPWPRLCPPCAPG